MKSFLLVSFILGQEMARALILKKNVDTHDQGECHLMELQTYGECFDPTTGFWLYLQI